MIALVGLFGMVLGQQAVDMTKRHLCHRLNLQQARCEQRQGFVLTRLNNAVG
jgi:xanthosine utilization system XapX-like protein